MQNQSQRAALHAAILAQSALHSSFYLYDQQGIADAAADLSAAFGEAQFLYSLKNNPCTELVKTLLPFGFGTDAASLGEVLQSVALGIPKAKIQYSAPGKTMQDIATALPIATLIADSVGEVARIEAIAAQQGIVAEIGLRLHPNFSFDTAPYAPSKFGIEQAQAFANLPQWQQSPHLRIVGLHVHCRSQSLSEALLQTYHQNVLALAGQFSTVLGAPLQFINMGAGLGIPYATQDAPLALAPLAKSTNAAIAALHAHSPNTKVYIETGRFCVGNHGYYATKVLDTKTCGGKTYAILANTLNGFIRPCLANVLEHAAPAPAQAEPLYTGKGCFPLFVLQAGADANATPVHSSTCINGTQKTTSVQCAEHTATPTLEPVTLVGNLCTAADLLASDIMLPRLAVGDVIVLQNAGSYAAVLSPMQFSQQVPPAQLMFTTSGKVTPAQ